METGCAFHLCLSDFFYRFQGSPMDKNDPSYLMILIHCDKYILIYIWYIYIWYIYIYIWHILYCDHYFIHMFKRFDEFWWRCPTSDRPSEPGLYRSDSKAKRFGSHLRSLGFRWEITIVKGNSTINGLNGPFSIAMLVYYVSLLCWYIKPSYLMGKTRKNMENCSCSQTKPSECPDFKGLHRPG